MHYIKRITLVNQEEAEDILRDAFVPPVIVIEKGEQIKLVGKITQANVFQAEEIRPWGGDGHWKKMRERMQGGE